MQNCSLTSLPFHPFTYSGPIVFVLIKQLLARMNRDVYTLVPACTPTCYFTCYVHAYARMLDHSPPDCTANLHLTAIKNSLRGKEMARQKATRRNEERQKKPQGRIEVLYSVHVEQFYFLFYDFFIQRCTLCGECGTSGW